MRDTLPELIYRVKHIHPFGSNFFRASVYKPGHTGILEGAGVPQTRTVDDMDTSTRPNLDTFAARLAIIRWNHGLNMKEAATIVGVPPASWREWELNGKQPRDFMNVCRRISDRLNVDLQWLVFGPELPRLDSNQEPAGSWYVDVA